MSPIDDIVDGAVIATETTFDDFSLNIGKWFGFDRFEGGSTINFIRPVDGATYTVTRPFLYPRMLNDNEKGIATTRGEDDSPILLSGAYIDQTQQFRYSTQRARRILFPVPSTRSTREMSLAVPIVHDGQRGYQLSRPSHLSHGAAECCSHVQAAASLYVYRAGRHSDYHGRERRLYGQSHESRDRAGIVNLVAAVNLYTDEIISLEGDSGNAVAGIRRRPGSLPAALLDDLGANAAYSRLTRFSDVPMVDALLTRRQRRQSGVSIKPKVAI